MTLNSSEFKAVTPCGRTLAVNVTGDSDGYPVFLMHGTPGSRSGPKPRGILLYRLGLKLISYDRPGYGGSDRAEQRTVADAVRDVLTITERMGIESFAVVGRSGGGPHALAVAAQKPGLVTSVAVLVSLAPYDAADLDWFGGMNRQNVREYTDADTDTSALLENLTRWTEEAQHDPRRMIELLGPELCEFDQRVVGDVALRRLLLDTYEEGLRQGPAGWIDDVLAFRRPWKFELTDVCCRAMFWHGANDSFSPVEHTRWLHQKVFSANKAAELHVQPEIGHFGAVEILPNVLSWIADGIPEDRLRRGPEDLSHGRADCRTAVR